MGYYQGDYYRGDYYQGFPIGAMIGGAMRIGSKIAKPLARGAVALGKKGVALLKKTPKSVAKAGGVGIGVGTIAVSLPKSGDEVKTEGRMGIDSGAGGVAGPRGPRLGRDGQPCAKRFGGRGCSHRMNVGNTRALRRSIRRARGFAKLARKVMTFPISKPPRGRGLFKKSKR